jgi:hypothetical protein
VSWLIYVRSRRMNSPRIPCQQYAIAFFLAAMPCPAKLPQIHHMYSAVLRCAFAMHALVDIAAHRVLRCEAVAARLKRDFDQWASATNNGDAARLLHSLPMRLTLSYVRTHASTHTVHTRIVHVACGHTIDRPPSAHQVRSRL